MTDDEMKKISHEASELYKILKCTINDFCFLKKHQGKIEDWMIANAVTNGIANLLAFEVGMLCVDNKSELDEKKRVEMITTFMQGIIADEGGFVKKSIQEAIIFVNQNYKCIPGVH